MNLSSLASKFQDRPNLEYVWVGDEFIAPKLSVCNLGVIMDYCLCTEQHVKKICSEAGDRVNIRSCDQDSSDA